MILIDTHIWIWWVSATGRLRRQHTEILESESDRLGLSIISCWEVAKLVQYGRLDLDRPVSDWINAALSRRNLELLPLTPAIIVESTALPEPFQRDPADQLIVATARVHGISLMTEDLKILGYPHVQPA
ncbi:MAG: type II toxin-antitoxin system VapC family toxin [Acidobacteriota bacterium]|nr:type II toxin-antitoxin system VapC family toxin [Acidobacteriota bacterium]